MVTIADRSDAFAILEIVPFTNQVSFGKLSGGGAEAANVGRNAAAFCIVTNTMLAFLDAETLRADFVPGKGSLPTFRAWRFQFTETNAIAIDFKLRQVRKELK